MTSKTEMYKLLRLIDMGCGEKAVDAAVACWVALPAETRDEMRVRGASADMRRARLWAAAWDGGWREAGTVAAR